MNRRSFARALFVFFTALSILGARVAGAAEPSSATAIKARADAAFDSLKYDEAIAGYTEAYALSKDPALLYNRGRSYQAVGALGEALGDLQQFAREAPPELRAKVPQLDQLIVDLKAKVSTVTITTNVGQARILVRDRIVGTSPLARPLTLTAGAATIEVSADGYVSFRRAMELPAGGAITVDAQLTANVAKTVLAPDDKKAPASDSAEKRSILTRWWFWTGVGVVVAAGAAVTFALLTEESADTGNFSPGRVSAPLVRW